MISRNFEDKADYKPQPNQIAAASAALHKITVARDLLDQAGQDLAAVHIQAAIDVLSLCDNATLLTVD